MSEDLSDINSLSESLISKIEKLFKDNSINDFFVKDSLFKIYHNLNCLTFILEKKYGTKTI